MMKWQVCPLKFSSPHPHGYKYNRAYLRCRHLAAPAGIIVGLDLKRRWRHARKTKPTTRSFPRNFGWWKTSGRLVGAEGVSVTSETLCWIAFLPFDVGMQVGEFMITLSLKVISCCCCCCFGRYWTWNCSNVTFPLLFLTSSIVIIVSPVCEWKI